MFSSSPIIAAFARGSARAPATVAEENSSADIEDVASIRPESVRTAENDLEQESPELLANTIRKRRVQHVSTLKSRREVVRWMVSVADADGEKNVVSRTVKQFPSVFRTSEKANLMKASRWWKSRNEILCADKAHTRASLSAVHSLIRKTVLLKAMTGRGRPQSPWVKSIHPKLLSEFERLSGWSKIFECCFG
jgi:hypothetical protein